MGCLWVNTDYPGGEPLVANAGTQEHYPDCEKCDIEGYE